MNLINDAWIPAIRADGTQCLIAPWQIAETDNPVMELAAVRPDFQGALYQFLIGLLQTVAAPENIDKWMEIIESGPNIDNIKQSFLKCKDAMELYSNINEPAFFQDLNLEIEEKKLDKVSSLLIDSIETHFNHDIENPYMCSSCAAQALMTLQLSAPPGGSGHMPSLRGNGPLTAVLKMKNSTLFFNLMINVMQKDIFEYKWPSIIDKNTMPWLGTTKTSESCKTKECKNGCERCSTFVNEDNFLQSLWGMPKRIRLIRNVEEKRCCLCGQVSKEGSYNAYIKNKGIRYMGFWKNHLTPYKKDKKHKELPRSLRGNDFNISNYSNMLGLLFDNEHSGFSPSRNITEFRDNRFLYLSYDNEDYTIWVFGYHIKIGQAKPIFWYESNLPFFYNKNVKSEVIIDICETFIIPARDVILCLKNELVSSKFKRISDRDFKKKIRERVGYFSYVERDFWNDTSPKFYELLKSQISYFEINHLMSAKLFSDWAYFLIEYSFHKFDEISFYKESENSDLGRIISARNRLEDRIKELASINNLIATNSSTKEAS